ncbi:uncharacterized protein LOC131237902 isoform X1 [Magnolia sinica]|uniref:uncharacterized protein LOC131237902 isoform X1 n=1 Tax=Magnolia sinica TaxID=86752 RepID=UPI002657BB33|nr:uncharacterized protein LOC131237902 isoform X1 [Magnolia sinica]
MAEDPVVNTISTENKNSKDEINSIPAKESSRGITEPVALEKQLKVEDGQHNPSSKTEEIITKTEETTQENDGILLETDENEAANSSIRVDHFTESSLQVMGTLEGALETSNAGEKREDPTPIIAKELENDSQLQKQHISESEEGKHRIKKTDSSEAEVSEEIEGESSKIVSEDRNVGSIEERDKPGKEKPISAIGLDEPSVSQAAVATDPVEHEKGSKNNEDLPGSAAEEQNLEVGAGSEIKEREIETEETTEKNDGKSVACLIEETDHEKLSLRQFSSSDADGQIPVSADHSKLMESEVQHEEKVSNQSFNTISVAQVSDEESQQKGGPASEKIDRTAESVSDEQIVKTNTAGRDADEASVEKHSDVSSSGEVPEGKTDLGKVGATESVEAEDCEEEGSIDKDLDADAVHIRQESEESRLQEDRIEGKEIETVTTDPNTQNNETKNENNEESSALVHDKKIRQPNDAIQNIEEEIRQKEDAAYVTTVTEETSLQKAELEEQKPKQAADIASEEKSRETNEADSQLEEVEGVKIEETSIPASEIPPVGESDGADKEKPDELPVIQALVKEIPQRDESQDNEPKCVSKPVPEEKNAEEIIETGIETAEIQKEEESPHEVPSTEAEANARKKIQTEADFLEKNADISSIAPASKEMPLLKEEGEKTLQKAELEDEKHEQGADIVSEEKSHETNETGSHFEEVEVVKTEETSIPASKIPLVGESDGADKESPVEVKPLELPVIQALVKEILQRDESQDNKPKGVSKPVPEEKNAEDIIETENATAEIQKEEESPHEVPSTEVEADAREKIETEIRSEADFLEKNPDISSVAPASEEMPSLKEEGEHANIIPQTVPSERDFDSLPTTQEATGGTDIVYENPAKASDIASEEEVERTADANTSSSEILVDDSSDKKLQEFSELKSEERVVESVHVREKTDEPQVTQALIEESLQKHKIKGQGPEKATELVLEEKNAEEIIVTENAAAEIPKEEENPHETPATETPAEEDTQDHGLKTADTRANIKTEIPMEEEIQENNVDASSVPPVEETSTQQEQGQQANIVPETVSKDCDCDASSTMQEVINSGEIEYERLAKASDKVPEDQEAETSSSQILVDDSPIEKLHESSELKPEDQIPIGNGTQDKHVEERCLQGEVEGDKLEEVTAAVSEDKETTSETETIREIRKDKESSQKEENEKPYKAPDLEAKDNVSEAKEADKDLEREIAEEKKESYESTISSSTLADDKAGENLAEPVEEVSDEQDLGTTDSGSKIENEVPNKEKAHHINVNASYVSQSSEEICSQKEAAETEETQNKGDDIAAATQAQGEKAFDSASEDTTVETVVEAEPAKIKISEGNESCDTMIDSPSTVKASVEETTQGAPADELEENTEKKIEKSEATAGTSSQIEEMEGKMLGKDYEHPEQKLSEITNAGEISNDADTSEPISNKDTLEGKKIEKTFDAAPEELETTFGREVTTKEVLEKEEVPVKNLEESFQEDGKGVESREHGAAELHRASYNTTNEEILRAIDPPVEIEADETKDKEIPDNNIDNLPVRNAVAEETIQEKRGEEQDETSEFVPEETAPEKVGSASESVSKDQGNEKITETETTETLPSVTEEQTCKAVEVSESKESAALEEEKTSDGATSGSQLQMENEEDGKELDSGDKSENFVALESREEEMPKKEETSGTDLENDGTEYDQLEKPADIVSEVLETAHQSEEIEKQIVEEEGTGKGIDTIPAGDEQVEESLEESEEHKMPEGATPELDAEDLSCNTNDISEITIPHEEVSEALAVDDLDTLSATDKPAKESSWEDEKTHEKLEEATRHLEAEGQSCEAIDTNDDAKDGQNEEVQASDLVSEERDLKTIASTEKIETVTVKAAEDPNETIDASTVKITESDEPLAMVSEGPETTSGGEDSEKHIIEGTVKGVDDVSVQEEPVGESQCKKLDEVTPEMEVEDQTCKTNDIIEIPNEEVFEGHKAADAGENVEKQTTEEEGVVKDLNTSSTRAAAIEENFQEDEHKKLEEATPQLEAEDQHYESNDTTYPTKSSQNDQVEASDLVSKEQEYETTGPTEAIESVTTKSDENPNEMSDASPVKTASIENPSNTVPEGIETAGVCKDAQKQIIEEEGTVKGIDDVPVQDESVEEIQCKKFEEATPEFEAEDQSCRTNDIINIPNEKVSEGLMAAAASENVQKQKTEEEGVVKDLNTSSTTAVMVEENLQEVEHKELEEATPQSAAEDGHDESNDGIDPTKSGQNEEVEASDLVSTTSSTEAIETATSKGEEDTHKIADALPVETASTENPLGMVSEGLETAGRDKDAQKHIIEEEGTVKGIDTVSIIDEPVQESEECKKPKEATFELEAEDQSYHTNDVTNITKVSEGHEATVTGKDIEKPLMEEVGAVKDLDSLSAKDESAEESIQEDLKEHKKLEEATTLLEIEDVGSKANDTIDTTQNGQDEEVKVSDLVSKERDFETTASAEKIETVTLRGLEDPNVIIDASPVTTTSAEIPLNTVSEELGTIDRGEEIEKQITEEEGTAKSLDSASVGEEPFEESESQKLEEKTPEMEANDQSHKTDDNREINNSNMEVPEVLEAAGGCENSEKQTIEEERAVKDLDTLSAKEEEICSQKEAAETEETQNKRHDIAAATQAQGEKAFDSVSEDETIETVAEAEPAKIEISESNVSCDAKIDSPSTVEASVEETTRKGAPADVLEENTEKKIEKSEAIAGTSLQIEETEVKTLDKDYEHPEQKLSEIINAGKISNDGEASEPSSNKDTLEGEKIGKTSDTAPEEFETAGGRADTEKDALEKEEVPVKNLEESFKEDGKGGELLEHGAAELHCVSYNTTNETTNEENLRTLDPTNEIETDETKEEENPNKNIDNLTVSNAVVEEATREERGEKQDEAFDFVPEVTEPEKLESASESVSEDKSHEKITAMETTDTLPSVANEQTGGVVEVSESMESVALEEEKTPDRETLGSCLQTENVEVGKELDSGDKPEKSVALENREEEMPKNDDTSLQNDGTEYDQLEKPADIVSNVLETAHESEEIEKRVIEEEGTGKGNDTVPARDEKVKESLEESEHRMPEGVTPKSDNEDLSCNTNDIPEITLPHEEVSEALAVADESENVEKQTKEEGGIGDLYTISATDKPVKESTQEDEKKHEKLEEPTHHLEAEEQSCKANDTSEAAKDGQNEEVQASDLVSEERDLETIASTEKIETVILKAAEDPNETIDASSVKIAMSDEPLESVSEGPETTGGGEDSEKHIIEGTVKGVDDVSVQGEPVEESQCKKLDEVTSKMEVEDQTCKTNDIIDIPNEEVFEVYKAADAGENVEKQTIEEEGVVKDLNTSSTRAAAVEENFQEDEHKKHEEATPQLEAEDQHYESDDAIDPTKSSQNEEVKASYLVPKEQEFETTSSTEAIESVGSKGDGDQNEMTDASPVKTASTEHTLDRLPVELEIAGEGEDTQKQTIEEEVTVKGVDTASIIDEQAQESEECEKPKEATFELEAEDQSCHTNDVNNITEVSEGHEAAVVGKDIEKPLMEEEDAVMDLDSLSAKGELAKESILEDLKGNKKLEEATPHLEIEDKDSEEKDTIDTTQTGQHKEVSEALVVADASENVEKQTKEEGGIGDLYAISATDKPVKESTQEDEKKHEKLEEPTHHLEAEEQSCKANDTSEAAKDGQNEEVQASDLVSEERDLETIASTEKIETVILKATEDPNETIDASSVKIAMSDEPLESVSEGPETTGGGEDSEKHIIKGTVKGVDGVSVQGEPVEESQCKKLDEVTSRMEVEDQTCKTNDVIDIPNEEVFEVYKAADAGENVEKQTTEEEGVVKDLNTSSTRAAAVEENFQEDEHKKHEEATPQLEAEDQHYESDDAIDPTKSSQNEEVKASYLVPKEQDFETTSSTEAIESVGSKGDGDQNEMTNASPVKTASTEYTLDRLPVELERAGVGEDTQKQTIEEEVTIKGVDTASTIDEPAQESEECEKPKEATFELEAEDQSCHTNDVNNITEVSKGHEAAVVVKDIEKPLMEEEDAVTDLDSLSAKDESAEESILEDLKEKKKLEEATPHLEIEDKDSEEKDTIDTTQTGQDKEVKALNLVTKEQDFETTASTEKIETVTLKGDEDPNVIIDASPVKTTSAETPLDTVSEKLEIEKQIIEEEDAVKSLDRASVGEEPIQESESQKLEEKTAEMEANDQSHKTEDITEIENSNVEVPEGLEAASGCENSEKQMIEEERAVKDLDTLSSKDEAVEESFQEALKEHKKLDEATCHSEAEEQSCEVNDTTHTITDSQSEEVEASDLVSTERNFETTLSTEKIEAVTLKSDENPNEVIDSSPIETPSGEETKQEGGGAEHQEAIGFVSEEKSIVLDITTEDTEDKKPERALESVSEEGGPSKIEILNDDESPDKTVDALPNSRASVQESTQKETPQVEDEQCCKEPNELSESTESTVLDEVKAANGTESEQLETSCEFGSEDKSKQTDTGDNKADDIAKEEETLYADMEEDRTESEQLQEPSQTSVGLKTAVADENTENQIIEQKSSVADIDTAFVGVEAVEETIQEDENESMKVGEAAAELEPEGQTSETKETNETATNRVHIEEASMGLGAADSSENIEKHMTGEDKAAKELDTIPVRGEVPSLETNDADDTTKTGIPSEKIETVIVEDDKASHKNTDVFPITTTLTEEITREEACDAKEEIHETISANERNVEVAMDEVRISEGPIEVEKVSTFDDSDSICETSNLSDAAEAPNLKDDKVLNRSPDVSAIAKASGVEILRKENATEASIWVPEEITEAAFEKAAAEESFSKGEIEREKLKEEVIHQTRETETSKHEENQQMGLDSPPIPKASVVEILQKEGQKPGKASDLESDEQIQEIIGPKDVEEIHIPRPEESTYELQDPEKLQDTTDVVLEELGHEKVGARETAEIAIEEEENPQKNIDGLSVTHRSDEGGKIEETADSLPEAPSDETVTAIDSTDPAPTETTTLESKEENVKFVTIPESEKTESVTLTAEESLNRSFDVFSFPQASGEETSQIEGSEKHAGSKEILQDNDNKATLQNSCDLIEKTSQKAIVEDQKLGEASEVEADLKGAKLEEKAPGRAAKERTEAPTEDSIEELKESDSGKVSLSDLLERSKRDNMKMPADLMQERHPAVDEDELRNKQAAAHQAEEEKSDEEEEEDDEHKKDESGSDAPVIVEAARDIDLKPPHKKSHNILSGVGSKVKHSIAKVKKAITGKSTHPKSLPAK